MLGSTVMLAILGFGYMALRDFLSRQIGREHRRQRFQRIVHDHESEFSDSGNDMRDDES